MRSKIFCGCIRESIIRVKRIMKSLRLSKDPPLSPLDILLVNRRQKRPMSVIWDCPRSLGSVSQDTGRPRSDLGILIPGPDHGFKILRSGNLSRARHTSPPGKRGEADLKNDLQPVPATTRTRLHPPSRKPASQEVKKQPGQIEALDLASPSMPKSKLKRKSKKDLVSL